MAFSQQLDLPVSTSCSITGSESFWVDLSLSFLVYKSGNIFFLSSILWASIQLPFNWSAAWLLGGVSFKTTPGELLRTHQWEGAWEEHEKEQWVWTMRSTQLCHTHSKGTASLQCSPSLCSARLSFLLTLLYWASQCWFLCILSSRKTQVWFSNGSLKNLPLTGLKVRMTHLICFPLWGAVIEHIAQLLFSPPRSANNLKYWTCGLYAAPAGQWTAAGRTSRAQSPGQPHSASGALRMGESLTLVF